MGEKKRTPFQERGQVLGGFFGREQVRPLGAELPLAAFRDVFVLGPLTDGPPPDSEKSGQFGVGRKSESFLDGCFGHHHGRKSRPLDPGPVKHSSQSHGYGSSPMDTFSQRLQRALTLRGMKPADLVARKVLSKAGIYFLLDGTTKPEKIREETVTKLCKALSVNREWLLHGKGPIEGDDDRRDPRYQCASGRRGRGCRGCGRNHPLRLHSRCGGVGRKAPGVDQIGNNGLDLLTGIRSSALD